MAKSSSGSSPGGIRRLISSLFKWGLTAGLLGLVALGAAVAITYSSLPSFEEMKASPNGQTIRVRAADGTVIVSLGPSYGDWLASNRIPEVMKQAIIAVEDRRFDMHPGVDPIGIARAFYVNTVSGSRRQGASTITQQLARNIFLSNTRTFGRKFREIILALALEAKFSKNDILELYLNRVYFGGGAYGVDAASRTFFGHGADRLSLAESAIIAGLVKAPSRYSPTADAVAARGRAAVVLETMREAGVISPGEVASTDLAGVKLVAPTDKNSVRYFTDWALPQLDMYVTEKNEPLEVWTTLDLNMQRAADAAIRANVPEGAQGALVALDRDGAVRAMVGGTDYVTSIYNRATQSNRQPGSAWKLFVYLAALEAGVKPDDPIVDEPIDILGWSPRNSNGKYSGNIDVRTGFAFSVNTVAAKLGAQVGFNAVAAMAQRFGISTPINTQPSMVLGTADVRLIEMTQAFAAINRKGVAVTPYGIIKVTTGKGELLYTQKIDDSRVLVAPWVAAQMTDLLQTAVNTGTGRAAQIGRPVAGKTGTTSSNKDGWFLGFSSGITTGVWMGRDNAKPVSGLQGGRAPARAFSQFMQVAVAKRPVEQFDTNVTLPEWQLEPDEEVYLDAPVTEGTGPDAGELPIDPNIDPGNKIPPNFDEGGQQTLDRAWLDNVLDRPGSGGR